MTEQHHAPQFPVGESPAERAATTQANAQYLLMWLVGGLVSIVVVFLSVIGLGLPDTTTGILLLVVGVIAVALSLSARIQRARRRSQVREGGNDAGEMLSGVSLGYVTAAGVAAIAVAIAFFAGVDEGTRYVFLSVGFGLGLLPTAAPILLRGLRNPAR